ncbi:MAG: hypothetical protein QOG64_1801 [Acidimicrobiaceae bacterium]|nr:hypothetical protein [Acidimicrobiaceae bacterium]
MFYRMKGMKDGFRNECKACNLAAKHERYLKDPAREIARVKKWQQENAERVNAYHRVRRARPEVKEQSRAGHLKRKFGLTLEQYDEMLAAQLGGCAICGDPPEAGKALHIDHDHDTGEVRGLLCVRCNNGLGQFKEDLGLLSQAGVYLAVEDRDEAAKLTALARRRAMDLVAAQ